MRRLRAAAVVLLAMGFAACYSLNLSSTAQSVDMSGPPGLMDLGSAMFEYDFGTLSSPGSAQFALLPGGDDYEVDSYTSSGACNLFPISATNPPLDGTVGMTRVYSDPTNLCTQGGTHLRGNMQLGDCPYPFMVGFTPQSGAAQCTYKFHYFLTANAGSDGYIFLTLDGSGDVKGITASPSTIGLSAPVNTPSGPGTATVTNIGTGSAQGSAYIDDTAHYSLSGPQPWVLPGQGSSQAYQVTCQSAVAGSFPSTLHFQESTGSAATIALTCDVSQTNGLTFTGSPVNFPLTLVNTMATDQSLTATNTGTPQPITFTIDSAAAGANVTMTPPSPYMTIIGSGAPSGTSVPVTLHWTPTVAISGKLGAVNVAFGSAGSAITFPVQINGAADTGNVAVNPTSIEFGAVCIGPTVPAKQLDIYNTGGADVTLTNISQPGSPYSVTPLFSNAPVIHGHGNDLTATVTVTPLTAGELVGSATLNLRGMPAVVVPLHATAVGAGVTATPGALAFGTTIVGGTSNRQQFALSNCGAGDLTIQRASITNAADGTPSNDFRIAMPDPIDNTLVQMTKAQTIAMEMTPQSGGHKVATLTLTLSDGGTQTIALDGSGGGPPPIGSGGGQDRQTYYACSTGRPLALVPIGLVVAWLARRRRRR